MNLAYLASRHVFLDVQRTTADQGIGIQHEDRKCLSCIHQASIVSVKDSKHHSAASNKIHKAEI